MKDGEKNKAREIDPFKNWRLPEGGTDYTFLKPGPRVQGKDIIASTLDASKLKLVEVDYTDFLRELKVVEVDCTNLWRNQDE